MEGGRDGWKGLGRKKGKKSGKVKGERKDCGCGRKEEAKGRAEPNLDGREEWNGGREGGRRRAEGRKGRDEGKQRGDEWMVGCRNGRKGPAHLQMKGWMSGWLLHGIWWMETCFRWFAIIQTLKVTTRSK